MGPRRAYLMHMKDQIRILVGELTACVYRKSDSAVLMMKAAEDRL